MSEDQSKWHWAEGNKYALESIKALLIVNGAAAVSILTFIGNTKTSQNIVIHTRPFVYAMVCFAAGAASAVLTMIFAYLTQLHYGNAQAEASAQKQAARWHRTTYVGLLIGLVFFCSGVAFAACGLLR